MLNQVSARYGSRPVDDAGAEKHKATSQSRLFQPHFEQTLFDPNHGLHLASGDDAAHAFEVNRHPEQQFVARDPIGKPWNVVRPGNLPGAR
ncbi:hypothetical protein ABTK75_18815, partial [Acinetobacter baumannii]